MQVKISFEERNPIFIPTISGIYGIALNRLNLEHMFWRKECPVYYPRLMIPTFAIKRISKIPDKSEVLNFVQKMKMEPDVFVMTDSGGFQLWRGYRVTPQESLEYQVECLGDRRGIMFTLDHPIGMDMSVDEVRKAMKVTAENTRIMLDILDNKFPDRKFMFYAVLQVRTVSSLIEEWWKKAVEPFLDRVDGVGVSLCYYPNLLHHIAIYSYLAEKGVKNVHVFGISTTSRYAATALFANHFDTVTFDTTSFTTKTGRAGLITGVMTQMDVEVGRKSRIRKLNYDGLKCYCPACRRFADGNLGKIFLADGIVEKVTLTLHELFSMLAKLTDIKLLVMSGRIGKLAEIMGISEEKLVEAWECGLKYLDRDVSNWL